MYLQPYTKINSKCVKVLMCMKPQTLKLLEKNIGSALKGMDRGKAFLTRRTPFTQELMLTDKWELIKLQISV